MEKKLKWYGIEEIEFIPRGASDALINYNGKIINSVIVEDTMWERFHDDMEEGYISYNTKDIHAEDYMDELDAFAEYMRDRVDEIIDLIEMVDEEC